MNKTETHFGGKSNAFMLDIQPKDINIEDKISLKQIDIPKEQETEIKSSVISQLKT